MVQIFQGVWEKTEKYNNFTIRLGEISDVLYITANMDWNRGTQMQEAMRQASVEMRHISKKSEGIL